MMKLSNWYLVASIFGWVSLSFLSFADPVRNPSLPSHQDLDYLMALSKKANQIIDQQNVQQVDQSIQYLAYQIATQLGRLPEAHEQLTAVVESSTFSSQSNETLLMDVYLTLKESDASFAAQLLTNQGIWQGLETIPYVQIEKLSPTLTDEFWILAMQYSQHDEDIQQLIGFNLNGEQKTFDREEAHQHAAFVVSINESIPFILEGHTLVPPGPDKARDKPISLEKPADLANTHYQLKLEVLDVNKNPDFIGATEWLLVGLDYRGVQFFGLSIQNQPWPRGLKTRFNEVFLPDCEKRPFQFFVVEKDFNPWLSKIPEKKTITLETHCNGKVMNHPFNFDQLQFSQADDVLMQYSTDLTDKAFSSPKYSNNHISVMWAVIPSYIP